VQQRINRALCIELRERRNVGVRAADPARRSRCAACRWFERSSERREGSRNLELTEGEADLRIGGRIEFGVHGDSTASIARKVTLRDQRDESSMSASVRCDPHRLAAEHRLQFGDEFGGADAARRSPACAHGNADVGAHMARASKRRCSRA